MRTIFLSAALVAVATLALTAGLYVLIPKGFFPSQDTGVIQGITEAPAAISFSDMAQKQSELARVLLKDPAVDTISSYIGVDGTNTTLNNGRFLINLNSSQAIAGNEISVNWIVTTDGILGADT